MANEADDQPERGALHDAAEREAAITWAGIEVGEETALRFCGDGYPRPQDTLTHPTGTIGWPFMSWVLRSWLDAGLVELYFDTNLEPDDELRQFGWLDRATVDRQWLVLRSDDAKVLVSDISLWGGEHVAGMIHLVSSDAGDNTPIDEWKRIARDSERPPPPLGESPGQRALLEWGNANVDWEALSTKWEFPVGGPTADQPGRVIAEPRLFIVRHRDSEGVTWGRVLAEFEEQIRSVRSDVDVWDEKSALADGAIGLYARELQKTVPVAIEDGLVLRKVL